MVVRCMSVALSFDQEIPKSLECRSGYGSKACRFGVFGTPETTIRPKNSGHSLRYDSHGTLMVFFVPTDSVCQNNGFSTAELEIRGRERHPNWPNMSEC